MVNEASPPYIEYTFDTGDGWITATFNQPVKCVTHACKGLNHYTNTCETACETDANCQVYKRLIAMFQEFEKNVESLQMTLEDFVAIVRKKNSEFPSVRFVPFATRGKALECPNNRHVKNTQERTRCSVLRDERRKSAN